MRVNLNLEELHVETTELQPAYDPQAPDGGFAASILWNTTGHQIPRPNTNDSSCIA